jgi:hypothetical protein
MVFNCPVCHIPIGEVTAPGVVDLLCPQCRYKYRILSGRLASKSSRQVTVQRQTTKQMGVYKRAYELRLNLPGGLEVVSFEVNGRDDQVLVRRGDDISIVHSLRDNRTEEMLAVLDHTTNQIFNIGTPGEKSRQNAALISCLGAVVAFFLSVAVLGPGAFIVALLVGVGLYAYSAKSLAPRHNLLPGEETVLAQTRSLLEQKQNMIERLQEVQHDFGQKEALKARLQNLRSKMLDVGAELYQTRIESIASALTTIEQQIALDQQLISGYNKAIKMLEIELETSARTDELPEDVLTMILAKSDELSAIRERNQELERLLSANEEVERLLRSG